MHSNNNPAETIMKFGSLTVFVVDDEFTEQHYRAWFRSGRHTFGHWTQGVSDAFWGWVVANHEDIPHDSSWPDLATQFEREGNVVKLRAATIPAAKGGAWSPDKGWHNRE